VHVQILSQEPSRPKLGLLQSCVIYWLCSQSQFMIVSYHCKGARFNIRLSILRSFCATHGNICLFVARQNMYSIMCNGGWFRFVSIFSNDLHNSGAPKKTYWIYHRHFRPTFLIPKLCIQISPCVNAYARNWVDPLFRPLTNVHMHA